MLQQDKDRDTLWEAGKQRLYPRITDPNWLVLRKRRMIFRAWLQRLPLIRPRVFDVGGRIQPYRELIAGPCEYWAAVDLRPTILVSAVANAADLPCADNSFDLVLCTQMIEYAAQAQDVLREIHCLLRPRGFLLLSAPSLARRDSEQDRWRFFPPVPTQLLSSFSKAEVVPECGSAAGMLRTVAVFVYMSVGYEALRLILSFLLVPSLNLLGAALDAVSGNKDGSFTVNYMYLRRSEFARKCSGIWRGEGSACVVFLSLSNEETGDCDC